MKKLTTFIIVTILLSCSSSDDSSNADSNINPPNWLIGTWLIEDNSQVINSGYRFTSDDVIELSIITEISYKGLIEQAQGGMTTNEIFESDTYELQLITNITTIRHLFKKETENTILIGINRLTKQ